jgi:DnaJ-class molecular chaperone
VEYKDYYATLGVPRDASQAEIRKQFRKLARQYHPDVNKGDAAAERRFKELNEANAVIGDPEKRKAYNALGADWEAYQRAGAPGGGQPFGGFGGFGGSASGSAPGGIRFEYHGDPEDLAEFSDFFRTFFAGGAPAGEAAGGGRRRTSTRTAGGLSFEDILGGLDIDGRGGFADTGTPRTGRRTVPLERRDLEAEAVIDLEEAFRGTTRLVQVDGKRLEVTIPRGVESGQRIRLSGKAGTGGGHLYVRVVVRPHRIFTRSGADLQRELPITLAEAMLGAEVPVETLKGRVLLRIPPETQSGRAFRLAGQGMPRFRAEGHGDLYAKVRVVLPTGLDEESRRLFRAFADRVKQPDPRQAAPARTGREEKASER